MLNKLILNSKNLINFPEFEKGLIELSVFDNKIEQIPDKLWNQSSLEVLNLSCNKIKFISEKIRNLINLRMIPLLRA